MCVKITSDDQQFIVANKDRDFHEFLVGVRFPGYLRSKGLENAVQGLSTIAFIFVVVIKNIEACYKQRKRIKLNSTADELFNVYHCFFDTTSKNTELA